VESVDGNKVSWISHTTGDSILAMQPATATSPMAKLQAVSKHGWLEGGGGRAPQGAGKKWSRI